MFRRAQDRIRGYFYKTREELTRCGDLPYRLVHLLMTDMHTRLKTNKYHGCYFDRRSASDCGDDHMKSICDSSGTFTCQGRWDKEGCLYNPPHSINPYVSKETRIVFQTWNLDHQKERTRSVIPAIRDALRHPAGTLEVGSPSEVTNIAFLDVRGIYNDLFTTRNLKLVHIICHDKGAHASLKSGSYLIYDKKDQIGEVYVQIEDDVIPRSAIKAA